MTDTGNLYDAKTYLSKLMDRATLEIVPVLPGRKTIEVVTSYLDRDTVRSA